jgi:hypothetical protein
MMIRGKLVILCIIFIFIGSLFALSRIQAHASAEAAGMSSENVGPLSAYNNSTLGMCLKYPSAWNKREDNRGAWLEISNESSARIRIESLPNNNNQTLDQFTTARINLTNQQFPGRELLEDNATIIGQNYSGHKIVFSHTEEPSDKKGIRFEESQAWTVNKDRIFVISYFAMANDYDNYLPIIKNIMDSFKPC